MKVFLADDSPVIRREISNMLAETTSPRTCIVGEADEAMAAIKGILELKPDVAILDIQMPNGNGIEVLQTVKNQNPNIRIIMLTNFLEYREGCLSLGADYFLDKHNEMEEIPRLIQRLGRLIHRLGKQLSSRKSSAPNLSDEARFFDLMDKSNDILLFADHEFNLRHINPAALDLITELKSFLPDKLENLIGSSLGLFHRRPSIIKKIIQDPRNLPFQSQILIGPKLLGLQVKSVFDETNTHSLGVVAHWWEIKDLEEIF